jgi:hypothetical protein
VSESEPRADVTESTRRAERNDAAALHDPDRLPTPDEEAAAETEPLEEGVAEHYKEMIEHGAAEEGEGRVG